MVGFEFYTRTHMLQCWEVLNYLFFGNGHMQQDMFISAYQQHHQRCDHNCHKRYRNKITSKWGLQNFDMATTPSRHNRSLDDAVCCTYIPRKSHTLRLLPGCWEPSFDNLVLYRLHVTTFLLYHHFGRFTKMLCGMKLPIRSQTLNVQPLTFGNG